MLRNTWTRRRSSSSRATRGRPGPTSSTTGLRDEARSVAESLRLPLRPPADRAPTRRAATCATPSPSTTREFMVILDADFAPRPTSWPRPFPTWTTRPSPSSRRRSSSGKPGPVLDRERRGRDPGGVLPVDPGRPRPVRRGHLRGDLRGLPAGRAGAAGRPALIPYAEDVHTGLDVSRDGWSIAYLPIVLSTGICPNSLDAFVRQQYRWCTGNVGIVCSWRLWKIGRPSRPGSPTSPGSSTTSIPPCSTFFGPLHPDRHAGLPAGHDPAAELRHPAARPCSPGSSCTRCGIARVRAVGLAPGHRPGLGPRFSLWDGAWGKAMSWHPTRTPGSSLSAFRIGVTWWSGGMAVLWVVLAIWRAALGFLAVCGPVVLRPAQPRRR